MKGKTVFWSSIVVGACVGGLLSLFNKEARNYSKEVCDQAGETVKYYTKNPDLTVQKVKNTVQSLSDMVSENTGSALNALDQVESTVNKFVK